MHKKRENKPSSPINRLCQNSCKINRLWKSRVKLVGCKWFSFRRLLMAGRSTVFSQTNAPLHSVFSCIDTILAHFHVWWHAKHTKWYCVNAFVLHLIPFVTLCWPLYKPYQAFLGLPLGEARGFPIWPFKSLKDVQNVRPGCQPKLGIAQGEPAWNRRCARGQGFSSVWCMRCRMDLNAFPTAQQKFAGFHLCILMNFVHSLNWLDL